MMKVVFAIPTFDGNIRSECVTGLCAAQRLLSDKGIPYDVFIISECPVITTARNTLVAMFMATDATDLFFIDADVGFDAMGVVEILHRREEIVAGIYPLKREMHGYPVEVKTDDGIPIGRDGLIEANLLPAGFMRIKRSVFERMIESYPELKYEDSVVEVAGSELLQGYDFFGMGVDPKSRRWTTEDYSFCQRWRDIGGQLWVYPDIDFTHVGRQGYRGNYHKFLLRQPGGLHAKRGINLEKAVRIQGWLSTTEAEWLAEQASNRLIVVELGCAYGRSTRAIADNLHPNGVLYAIDDWRTGIEEMTAEERALLYTIFRQNLGDHIDKGTVIPIQSDHGAIDPDVIPPIVDMVFIDGDHRSAAVKRDIDFWLPRVKSGGLLCGHDSDWRWVDLAVDASLPAAQRLEGTRIWYWVKP